MNCLTLGRQLPTLYNSVKFSDLCTNISFYRKFSPCGADVLCLPFLRCCCVYRPSLWGWSVVFIVSAGLMCGFDYDYCSCSWGSDVLGVYYRPCGSDVLCLPSLGDWFIYAYRPCGIDVLYLPSPRCWCISYVYCPWSDRPCGTDVLCLPSLWGGWCITFTIPEGLMCCVYLPCLWDWCRCILEKWTGGLRTWTGEATTWTGGSGEVLMSVFETRKSNNMTIVINTLHDHWFCDGFAFLGDWRWKWVSKTIYRKLVMLFESVCY